MIRSLVLRTQIIINIIIDSLFLLAWRMVTHLAEGISSRWLLQGDVSQFSARVFDWTFAIATIIPVMTFLIKDIRKAVQQIWNDNE